MSEPPRTQPDMSLTPREAEVLDLARRGCTNNEIAQRLGISRNAVRFHLKEVHSKLGTGSERSALTAGWKRALGLISLSAAKFGVPATVTAFAAVSALGGVLAYRSLPDDGARGEAPERFEGAVIVDGRYPNDCPAEYSAGTMTLEDFAHGNTTLEQLQSLNPDLPFGYLPPETVVRVPYDPTGTCMELQPTPSGSLPRFGTPPASK